MAWSELPAAVGLMLPIEGIVPCASPRVYGLGVSRKAARSAGRPRGPGLRCLMPVVQVRPAGAGG